MTLAAGAAQSGVVVDLLLILVAAGVAATVFGRLRLAAIPGYLIAGLLISIFYEPSADIDFVSQLAVILLMFSIGLHLDLSSLRSGAVAMLVAGAGSTLLSTLLITVLGVAFGLPFYAAIAVGMAMSLSSTAVVLRVIQQKRLLQRVPGRLCFSVLIVQDLAVVAMLPLIPILAELAAPATETATGEASSWTSLVFGALIRGLGLVVFMVVAIQLLPKLLAFAARVSTEVMLVVAAAVGLSAAVSTAQLGLSPELGAFVAGFVLASTPFRFQLAGQLGPLRDLFMAVFFTAVGLSANLGAMFDAWWIVLVGAVLLLAAKALSISLFAWIVGASGSTAVFAGVSLAQAGEFSLVVIGIAAMASDQTPALLSPEVQAVLIGIVILSLLVTPTLIDLAAVRAARFGTLPLAPWIARSTLREGPELAAPADAEPLYPEAVVAGFGPVGRAVAERLEAAEMPYSIIELNAKTVQRQRQLGRRAYYGDATTPEVLESAGVTDAKAVFVTIPDDEAMLRVCRAVKTMAPTAWVTVRADSLAKGLEAKNAGADEVIVEEIASAEAMASKAFKRLEAMEAARKAEQPADDEALPTETPPAETPPVEAEQADPVKDDQPGPAADASVHDKPGDGSTASGR